MVACCFSGFGRTDAINKVKDYPHSHAKLLKVQIPIIVDIGEVPNPLELIISQLAVFEYRSCLSSSKVFAAVR